MNGLKGCTGMRKGLSPHYLFVSRGLVINYGEVGYKMGKSCVRNLLCTPLKTG